MTRISQAISTQTSDIHASSVVDKPVASTLQPKTESKEVSSADQKLKQQEVYAGERKVTLLAQQQRAASQTQIAPNLQAQAKQTPREETQQRLRDLFNQALSKPQPNLIQQAVNAAGNVISNITGGNKPRAIDADLPKVNYPPPTQNEAQAINLARVLRDPSNIDRPDVAEAHIGFLHKNVNNPEALRAYARTLGAEEFADFSARSIVQGAELIGAFNEETKANSAARKKGVDAFYANDGTDHVSGLASSKRHQAPIGKEANVIAKALSKMIEAEDSQRPLIDKVYPSGGMSDGERFAGIMVNKLAERIDVGITAPLIYSAREASPKLQEAMMQGLNYDPRWDAVIKPGQRNMQDVLNLVRKKPEIFYAYWDQLHKNNGESLPKRQLLRDGKNEQGPFGVMLIPQVTADGKNIGTLVISKAFVPIQDKNSKSISAEQMNNTKVNSTLAETIRLGNALGWTNSIFVGPTITALVVHDSKKDGNIALYTAKTIAAVNPLDKASWPKWAGFAWTAMWQNVIDNPTASAAEGAKETGVRANANGHRTDFKMSAVFVPADPNEDPLIEGRDFEMSTTAWANVVQPNGEAELKILARGGIQREFKDLTTTSIYDKGPLVLPLNHPNTRIGAIGYNPGQKPVEPVPGLRVTP